MNLSTFVEKRGLKNIQFDWDIALSENFFSNEKVIELWKKYFNQKGLPMRSIKETYESVMYMHELGMQRLPLANIPKDEKVPHEFWKKVFDRAPMEVWLRNVLKPGTQIDTLLDKAAIEKCIWLVDKEFAKLKLKPKSKYRNSVTYAKSTFPS